MKKIIFFIIFLYLLNSFKIISEELEFQKKSFTQLIYVYTDDNGKKNSSYILDPIFGIASKTLINILSKHPEALQTFKLGFASLYGGAAITGLGLGFVIISPIYPVLYSISIKDNKSLYNYSSEEFVGLFLPTFLFFGIGIPLSILGIIMIIFYYKSFEKSFELFNTLERQKKNSVSFKMSTNDLYFDIFLKIKL